MGDENKFEFDIISNDLTDKGTASANKNFLSVEQGAARAAAGMSGSFDKANVEIVQSTQKASAAVYRSIQAFERQAALIGTSGRDRVDARISLLRKQAGEDQEAGKQIQDAVNKVIASYRKLDEATSRRTARSAIAETDARFNTDLEARIKQLQANNESIQRLQQDRIRATETPSQRLTRERTETITRYGGTSAQRSAIEKEFDAREAELAARQSRERDAEIQANNDAIRKLREDRTRALETPTQRVGRERTEAVSRYGATDAQRTAIDQEFSARMRAAQEQELRAGGVAAGKAVLSGEAEFQAALQKMQDNNAAIRRIQEERARAIETPVQRVGREREAFLSRYGGTDSQRAAIDQEFAARARTAQAQEVRAAGLAAGKAKLSGEAEFQAALQQVQTRDASIREIEERAAKASLSKPDFLRREMEQTLAQAGMTETAAKRVKTAYADLVKAAESEGAHGGSGQALRRIVLGIKDFLEGSTRGAIIEGTDVLIGTSGRGGILPSLISKVSEFAGVSRVAVIAAGSLAAGLAALGIAGVVAMRGLGERAQDIRNFSLRTGIAPTRVQAFEFAATAEGAKPEIFERMTRGLAEVADDYSPAGTRARREVQRLGVSLRDQFGDLKPTEQIILELADGINKLPPGLQRSAASMEIFKRIGIEAIPVLENLRENLKVSDQMGGTISSDQFKMAEEWDRQLKIMGEHWKRFKMTVEFPLAIIGNFTLKAFGVVSDLIDAPVKAAEAVHDRIKGMIANPAPNRPAAPTFALAENIQKARDRKEADALIRQFQTSQGPAYQLEQARKEFQSLPELRAGETPLDETRAKVAAGQRVKQLESAEKAQNEGMRGVIEARKERLQLEAQHAEIQESTVQKTLLAGLDTKKELLSPDDIGKMLEAAEARANAEQNRFIESRRKTVDEKTGREIDLSNTQGFRDFQAAAATLLPMRIRNEYDKVLGELKERDTKYYKDRRDADIASFNEAQKQKLEAQKSLYQETKQLEADLRTQYFQQQSSTIERQKSLALQQLGLRDAQTPQERIRLADAQFGVETYYSRQALALQESKLTADRDIELGKQQAQLSIAGPAGQDDYDRNVALISQRYSNEIDAARQAESEKELIDAQKTSNEKAKITIEATKSVYQNLKEEANGLFDVLFTRTKSWADFGKQLLKTFVLTPVKDIFSSQVAGFFTQALTGQKVAFNEIGNGQGPIGRVGGILGRLGMGSPKFGDQANLLKLNAPGHLGDLSLVGGAVPVVVTNAAQSNTQVTINASSSRPSFGALAGLGGLFAGGATAAVRSPIADVTSRLITSAGSDYGPTTQSVVSDIFGNALPGAPAYTGASGGGGIFSQLQSIVGGPGGTSGFAGPVTTGWGGPNSPSDVLLPGQAPGGSSTGGGFLGGLKSIFGGGGNGPTGGQGGGGLFGGLKSMFGLDTSGTDMGGGVGIARQGFGGNLAAISKSSGFAMLGGIAAMDGIRRGGVMGTLEAAGGGAAIGFKYGGPWGALIGGAIGAGAALIKTFLGDDLTHTKDLVKQIYGIKINDATAKQIIAIAKQSYGGQISMAVRSQQVRDLLRLYAQTTGDTKGQAQFVADTVHGSSLVQANGQLSQQAIYDNGSAYAYQSPLSVYGGMQATTLPTYAPNSGGPTSVQLFVNGQSAADLLDGRIATTVTPSYVQGQSASAMSGSIGRNQQMVNTLAPSAITR